MGAEVDVSAYSEAQAVAWAWIIRDDHSYLMDGAPVVDDAKPWELPEESDESEESVDGNAAQKA
jgi:hypothetical protein